MTITTDHTAASVTPSAAIHNIVVNEGEWQHDDADQIANAALARLGYNAYRLAADRNGPYLGMV